MNGPGLPEEQWSVTFTTENKWIHSLENYYTHNLEKLKMYDLIENSSSGASSTSGTTLATFNLGSVVVPQTPGKVRWRDSDDKALVDEIKATKL